MLLKVVLPIASKQFCQRAYSSEVEILDSHVCAGGKKGRGICSGDSGGAIFCPASALKGGQEGPVLVGVDSFTAICALENYPSVFTRV